MNMPYLPNVRQWERVSRTWQPNPLAMFVGVLIILMLIITWATAIKTDKEVDRYYEEMSRKE